MAVMAYGVRQPSPAGEVRYRFGFDPEEPPLGMIVIPIGAVDSWYVQGVEGRPFPSAAIAAKAIRLHEQTGEWQEHAPVFA